MVCSLGFLDLDAILGDGEQGVSPLLTQGLSHLNKTSYAPSSSYDVGPCPSNNDFCQEASPISFTSPRDGKGAARLSMTIATTAMRVTRLVQKALHMESDDVPNYVFPKIGSATASSAALSGSPIACCFL